MAAGKVARILKSVDFEVFGRVQGVFFRKHTHATASKYGLVGWVMNTKRNTVIGCLQGESEKVDKMKNWLSTTGSPQSRISDYKFTNEKEVKNLAFEEFTIKRGKG